MAMSPCPQNDKRFVKLANELDLCARQKLYECDGCPQAEKCIREWSGLCTLTTMKKLEQAEYKKRRQKFTMLMEKTSAS